MTDSFVDLNKYFSAINDLPQRRTMTREVVFNANHPIFVPKSFAPIPKIVTVFGYYYHYTNLISKLNEFSTVCLGKKSKFSGIDFTIIPLRIVESNIRSGKGGGKCIDMNSEIYYFLLECKIDCIFDV